MYYVTFQDLIDHGVDYIGGNPAQQVRRDVIRAILEAYRELINAHNWSYLYTQGRIISNPAYDGSVQSPPATIQYQQSAGSYPYQVTLTGGTWPPWAGQGYLRCSVQGLFPEYEPVDYDVNTSTSFVAYKVAELKSATVLTLDNQLNPGIDLPAGTQFTLYCDSYVLPIDFVAADQAMYEQMFGGMEFSHPRDWLYENRYVFAQGIPYKYTIRGDKKWPGRMVISIYPWPYEYRTMDFIYKRRPRVLSNPLYTTGTVSGTSVGAAYNQSGTMDASGQTLTGVGTNWTPEMVGSVIRLTPSTTVQPSSMIMGTNPATYESVVTDYISSTSLVMQDPLDQTYSGVQYTMSDPIEIEPGAMMNAMYRCVEKHIGQARTLKDKPSAQAQYLVELRAARSADSRSFMGRAAGCGEPMRRRLRDYPIDLTTTM